MTLASAIIVADVNFMRWSSSDGNVGPAGTAQEGVRP